MINQTFLDQFPSDIRPALREASKSWDDIYHTIKYAARALFYGPPGTGKSRACSIVGMNGRNLERTAITAETCWPEIRGHWLPGQNGMEYWHGPGVRAWTTPNTRWVVDEIDQAGGDTVPGLHMLADDRDVARLTLPTGETVVPDENFQFFATTNADPVSLPEALRDRFVVKREVLHSDPVMLDCLPGKLRVAAAYSLYSAEKAFSGITSRGWIELGRLMKINPDLDMAGACRVMFGHAKGNDLANAIEVAALKATA